VVFDIKTLMIANIAVITLFCVAFSLHSLNRKTYSGFRVWTIGLFVHAVGLVFLMSRGILPLSLSIVMSNVLISCAIFLRLDALSRFLRDKAMNRTFYYAPVVIFIVTCYFHFVDDNLPVRGFVLCSFYAFFAGMFLLMFIRHAPPALRSLCYLGAFLVGLRAISMEVTAIEWIRNPQASLFAGSNSHGVNFFIAFFSEIGMNMVFLMMHIQRGEEILKKSKSKLIDSNNRFKSLSDTTFEGVIIMDKGIIVEANEHASRMFGYSGKELIGKEGLNFITPEKRDLAKFNLNSGFEEKYEVVGLRKDQSTCPIELHGKTFLYHGREVRIVSIRDLTEQKKSEQALIERKTLYEFLFEKNTSAMLIVDPETMQIVDVNNAACSFYGYTREKLISMLVSDINTLSKEEILQELAKAKSAKRNFFQFQHRLADASIADVEVFSGPIHFEGRSLFCSIILDVTERKIVEAEREKLILDLQNASNEISKLRGILPICSHCKNIRNDKGSWDRIELYIHQHSDLELSHGICPDCVKKLYPEFSDSILEESKVAS
jgi:PAS domain S-box-containing protein